MYISFLFFICTDFIESRLFRTILGDRQKLYPSINAIKKFRYSLIATKKFCIFKIYYFWYTLCKQLCKLRRITGYNQGKMAIESFAKVTAALCGA